ncbi:amino acid ABC transporter substrate-binding protein [Paenibacillus zeisoli]|uniref:Amino acid ABC transporter substrate-binding protein n=1 Tax=Paenibacillus zeisoli TaxID=2496267 RepID=A0A3S1B5M3_9BACL|nr:amino acid ABC transporter substrate-binding protein [Paenibacillus zeisoli]RUT27774.1 amino acid ABC transporter substrate-binding protein [Paenibacillus zeisoli]
MKKVSLALLVLGLSIAMVGCGANKSNNPSTPVQEQNNTSGKAAQTALETVKASGKLRIGTEGTYAPFTFHDKAGKLTGFDVEIAEEISKRIGVQPEFVESQWDSLIAGLDANRFDTVFNEVSITDERKAKYAFSDPYIVSKAVLIVREDNTDIKKFSDLKGKKAGQSLTTNLTKIAKENGAQIVAIEGFNQAVDLLTSNRIDATVNDQLSFLDLKKQKPQVPIKVVDTASAASQSAGLFTKGADDLVTAVNKALAEMKSDGTYLRISQKYFGEDVSK